MSRIIILGIAILAVLAIVLPKHQQWYQPVQAAHGNAYSYGVVECGHNDLCLGA
jgi:hypothetical protein